MAGYGYGGTDPIVLAAQARPMLETLHQRNDVVVYLKTNSSGFDEDALDEQDEGAPGHFRVEKKALTLVLDSLLGKLPSGHAKPLPHSLATIEDWRKHPVLAGVAAHESAHARFSLWDSIDNPIPESIDNPNFDPDHPEPQLPDGTDDPDYKGPEAFPVSRNGKLHELAMLMEEPRVERLGTGHFTKTWRRAMQMSASHLVLEQVDSDDSNGVNALDAAVRLTILIGGRMVAGTLGFTFESRKTVRKILDSAQAIIEEALPDVDDPFHKINGIISEHVFSNDHTDARPHLEAARRILEIVHPEEANDPDNGQSGKSGESGAGAGGAGSGEGEEDGEGEGEGSGAAAAMSAALEEMAKQMRGELDTLQEEMAAMIEIDAAKPESSDGGGGYGSVLYRDPAAPPIDRHEQPNAKDRELYRRALAWMELQTQPTITESEIGQWLPVGGARLDVRGHVRDNLAGHRASQRSDWSRVSETVKTAPPVKVGIMLDGSGSMSKFARPSASIAWAAANAAAQLPESRTVSVVYGDAAAVTQPPGHLPAKTVAVVDTNGGTEDFIGAAKMVEDALWLDQATADDEPTNVLIIIVSDLRYGGADRKTRELQAAGFKRIVDDWHNRGFRVVVVGAHPHHELYNVTPRIRHRDIKSIEIVSPEDLFR